MSVVGLTLGSGANASRPSVASAASVATSATVREDGRERSYQAKPPASASAEDRERGERPAHARASSAPARAPSAVRRACAAVRMPPMAAEDARRLGREVPAAR